MIYADHVKGSALANVTVEDISRNVFKNTYILAGPPDGKVHNGNFLTPVPEASSRPKYFHVPDCGEAAELGHGNIQRSARLLTGLGPNFGTVSAGMTSIYDAASAFGQIRARQLNTMGRNPRIMLGFEPMQRSVKGRRSEVEVRLEKYNHGLETQGCESCFRVLLTKCWRFQGSLNLQFTGQS